MRTLSRVLLLKVLPERSHDDKHTPEDLALTDVQADVLYAACGEGTTGVELGTRVLDGAYYVLDTVPYTQGVLRRDRTTIAVVNVHTDVGAVDAILRPPSPCEASVGCVPSESDDDDDDDVCVVSTTSASGNQLRIGLISRIATATTTSLEEDSAIFMSPRALKRSGLMVGALLRLVVQHSTRPRVVAVKEGQHSKYSDDDDEGIRAYVTPTLFGNLAGTGALSSEDVLTGSFMRLDPNLLCPIPTATLSPITRADLHSASTAVAAEVALKRYLSSGSEGPRVLLHNDVVTIHFDGRGSSSSLSCDGEEWGSVLELAVADVRDGFCHADRRSVSYLVSLGDGALTTSACACYEHGVSGVVMGSPCIIDVPRPVALQPVPSHLAALPMMGTTLATVRRALSSVVDSGKPSSLLCMGSDGNYATEQTIAAVRSFGRQVVEVDGALLGTALDAEMWSSLLDLATMDAATTYMFHHIDVSSSTRVRSISGLLDKALTARGAAATLIVVCVDVRAGDCPAQLSHAFSALLAIDNPSEGERARWVDYQLSQQHTTKSRTLQADAVAAATTGMTYADVTAVFNMASTHSADPTFVLSQEALLDAAKTHATNIGVKLTSTRIDAVQWKDIGGLANVKQSILEMVQLPMRYPHLYKNAKRRSGILLYGPPGCGKTLLAKAVATECKLNFMSVKGPELLNMYVGESERNVREVFRQAREAAPCVLFFDELDALAPNRGAKGDSGGVMDRIVSQLLAEIDGAGSSGPDAPFVFLVGATNRPDLLDQSLLRPGRFDSSCYLGIPNTTADQIATIRALTRKFKFGADVDLESIFDGLPFVYTGADYYALCSDAVMRAVEETGDVIVSRRHFEDARDNLTPSLTPEELAQYQRLNV